MDTLTHTIFGATLGGLVLGRRADARAYLWGAGIGNLPDIDALLHNEAIGYLLVHRGITHSLFFQTLAVPILVLLILAIHRNQKPHWRRWALLAWLALITHSLLDAMNAYGAQILAPFSWENISFNILYVVDPLFTVPLILGLILAWCWRKTLLRPILAGSVVFVMSYLVFAAGAKFHVQNIVEQEFARQELKMESTMVMPMPFTTLLWRVLAVDNAGYHEGYYSLAANESEIKLWRHSSEPQLLKPLVEHLPVQQLKQFSKGFYQVVTEGEKVVMRDLRLGQNSFYPVSFLVGYLEDGIVTPTIDVRMPASLPEDQIKWLWQRIWQSEP